MDRLKSRIENYAIIRAKIKGFGSCTVDKVDLKSLHRLRNAYYDKSREAKSRSWFGIALSSRKNHYSNTKPALHVGLSI